MRTNSHQLLLPLLAALCLAAAPIDELAERCNKLAARLPEMTKRAGVPGLSIAVANAEGVLWNQSIGKRDAASGQPVNALTVFEAASLSKPIFAYIVHRFVDEGILELDTPLVEYAELG